MSEYLILAILCLLVLLSFGGCLGNSSDGFVPKTHLQGYLGLYDQISSPNITEHYPYLPENKPHPLPRPSDYVYNRDALKPDNYVFNSNTELRMRYPSVAKESFAAKIPLGYIYEHGNIRTDPYVFNSASMY
jgi:hypothetical protein